MTIDDYFIEAWPTRRAFTTLGRANISLRCAAGH